MPPIWVSLILIGAELGVFFWAIWFIARSCA